MMLKKSLFLPILVLLFTSLVVSAISFDVTSEIIKDTITLNDVAEFNINIHNKLDTEEEYKIKTLDYPNWDIYTKPLQNPITLDIGPNESNSIKILVDPLHVLSVGTVDVNVRVRNERLSEDKIIQLRVSIVSTDSLTQGYVPTVIANVEFQENIDPREPINIKIRLDNQNQLEHDNLLVKLTSNTINSEIKESLNSKEKKDLELQIKLDPRTNAQEDLLTITVYSDDKIIEGPKVTKFNILSYSKISKDITPVSSFLKIKKDITFTNIGNSLYKGPVKIETAPIRSLFTLTQPRGKLITEEGKKYITWDAELEADASMKVSVNENYMVLLVIIIMIIISILAYKIYKSPLSVAKTSSNVEKKEGGISNFKIVLTIRNKGTIPIKDIKITDSIPNIAEIERELSIGTLQPTKILKHDKKGSIIKWIIDDLGVGEERIITYKVKSILPILGDFSLPSALIKFPFKNKEKAAKSNSLNISI